MNISLPDEITQAMTAGRGPRCRGGRLRPQRRRHRPAPAGPGRRRHARRRRERGRRRHGRRDGHGHGRSPWPAGWRTSSAAPPARAAPPAPPPLPGPGAVPRRDRRPVHRARTPSQQLQAGVAAGQVTAATLVWATGMAEWAPGRRRSPALAAAVRRAAPAAARRRDPAAAACARGPTRRRWTPTTTGRRLRHRHHPRRLRRDTPRRRPSGCGARPAPPHRADPHLPVPAVRRRARVRHRRPAARSARAAGTSRRSRPPTGDEVVEQDLHEAIAALDAGALTKTGLQVAGEKEVVCQNCGGHTTFTGTLTATRCPYCATPIQRDDVHDAPARLAVDGVLPFQIDRRHGRGRASSSGSAAGGSRRTSSRSTPPPARSTACTAPTSPTTPAPPPGTPGRRGDHYTVTVGSGDNRRTEVRTRWSHARRHGRTTPSTTSRCRPTRASTASTSQELEPWPTADARPFSAEYLAGHLCRTYDHDVDGVLRARPRPAWRR